MKIWHELIENRAPGAGGLVPDDVLAEILSKTWRQAALTMGVTTITTAVALLMSYFNAITAVMCFG